MLITNHFRLVGIVYENAVYTQRKDGLKVTKFTLVVKNNIYKPKEKTYLPIYVKGNDAIKAAHICRSGNKVAVNGRIETINKIDSENGTLNVEILFIAEDSIYLIANARKKRIELNKPNVITDWFCPDETESNNGENN